MTLATLTLVASSALKLIVAVGALQGTVIIVLTVCEAKSLAAAAVDSACAPATALPFLYICVSIGPAAAAEKVNLQDYEGVYGSKQLPIKITFKVENNKLVGQVQNQKSIEFDYDGNDKFVYEAAGLELQFSKDKKTMTLSQSGQTFDFTKE